MNNHSKTYSFILRSLLLLMLFSAAAFLLLKASLSPINAQTEERVFENTIPKEVPIRVAIKKEWEQAFKDLGNDKWVSEFELEVTNIGDKPIYYLAFHLVTNVDGGPVLVPDNVRNGRILMDIRYGSDDFMDIITKARPDDMPIKPSETVILTIDSREIVPWERSVRNGNFPQATKVKLTMMVLSYGDGTGHFGNSAEIYPSKRQD